MTFEQCPSVEQTPFFPGTGMANSSADFKFSPPVDMEVDKHQDKHQDELEIKKVKTMFEGKDMAECFALMYINHSKAMESVRGEIQELKTNIREIESAVQNTSEDIQDIHEKTIPEIKESVSTERKERLRLEVWGRKWNLIIKGVEGDTKEQPRTTERCVRAVLQDVLHIDSEHVQSILFQAAHRLPGGKQGKKNIIIRLNSLIDRDEILVAARKLPHGTGVSIFPDLPPEISDLRSKLLQERFALPPGERKKSKLIYTKEFPFVLLKKVNSR